ncbi:PhoH family protein, partial [Pseudomonadota bacterium]
FIRRGIRSGLRDARDILSGVEGVQFMEFGARDVIRHKIVTRIVEAYDKVEARRINASGATSMSPASMRLIT